MLPILLAFLAASLIDSAWNIYSTSQTTAASDNYQKYVQSFYSGAKSENTAYWDRYIKAHHLEGRKILYPYRTGYNFDESRLYGADSTLTANEYNRYGSYEKGMTGIMRGAAGGYAASGLAGIYRPRKTSSLYPGYN